MSAGFIFLVLRPVVGLGRERDTCPTQLRLRGIPAGVGDALTAGIFGEVASRMEGAAHGLAVVRVRLVLGRRPVRGGAVCVPGVLVARGVERVHHRLVRDILLPAAGLRMVRDEVVDLRVGVRDFRLPGAKREVPIEGLPVPVPHVEDLSQRLRGRVGPLLVHPLLDVLDHVGDRAALQESQFYRLATPASPMDRILHDVHLGVEDVHAGVAD